MKKIFFIPEDLELVRWQEDYGNEENLNDISYAQVNHNLQDLCCMQRWY